ncbi:hypothetical protein [Streptomyces sp. bgisy100]|uniref:hypothetical protein n=1 Tax=Streptomyces sp. bgisy100 TaxID=3413783 RepID=UPI003D7214A1
MSYPDPNNPYAQPQQGQNYGYPQQQPPGQPGYGYPQAPPVSQGYGGYPGGAPTTMPGGVTASRILLFVIAAFQVIGAALFMFTAVAVGKAQDDPLYKDDVQFQQLADFSTGAIYGFAVVVLAWGVLAVFLGAKFGKGGNGIRVTGIVFASITAVLGIYPFILVGLVHTILSILVIVFLAKADGAAWFNRPRY